MEDQVAVVAVHKAAISLMKNESLAMYTQALSNAAREHMKLKLNLQKSDGAYMVELFADKAVFNVYKYDGGMSADKCYAVKYTRKGDAFEFGDMVEVVRTTVYEAKANAVPVRKSKDGAVEEAAPGWASVEKALWSDVL